MIYRKVEKASYKLSPAGDKQDAVIVEMENNKLRVLTRTGESALSSERSGMLSIDKTSQSLCFRKL